MNKALAMGLSALIFLTSGCATDTAEEATNPAEDAAGSDVVQNRTQLSPKAEQSPARAPDSSGVTIGELDPDFPTELIPLDLKDEVLFSSVARQDEEHYTISLNARSSRPAEEILSEFEKALTDADFTAAPLAEVEEMAGQLHFTKESQTVTIGVLAESDQGDQIISVGGTVVLAE